ncbi:DUF4352 domain-containing protein [Actinoplanes sp. RD1]|uniref:DUF4352 domain-containing protein n=1 Tax=Actinoplanes sp. RD1 TaxID=3064538 RepID=UPI00274190A1|nr:DUF4352 domain-containing protein [Actinoplanes sp. RD1]
MSYPPSGQPPIPAPQPGYGPPPAAPAKKKRTGLVLGIVGGVLGLCCVGGVAAVAFGGGDDKDVTAAPAPSDAAEAPAAAKPVQTKEAAEPAKKPDTPGLGDAVRDGKFEFKVSKLDCSKTKVGSDLLGAKAQGKFCQISLTIKNIGKEAQYFDGSSQKALDSKGTEYSNDTEAEIYANEDSSTFLNEINPGNSVKGKLIFDVPKSVELTKIELHDSMFSGGVEVALS